MSTPQTEFGFTALPDHVLAALGRDLGDRLGAPWATVRSEIEAAVRDAWDANLDRASDEAARVGWYPTACFVLGCYRVLSARGLGRDAFMEAMRAPLEGWMEGRLDQYFVDRLGVDVQRPDEAFARVAENFKAGGERRFGDSFVYEQEVLDADRSFVNVRRCGFNDFFRANEAVEILPVLCALDFVGADAMRDRGLNVRLERPTLLSTGSDACRFQWHREPALPAAD